MPKETEWTISFYCGCQKCCNKEDNVSADGTQLTNADAYKVCAAPKTFAFGTEITISGGWSGAVTVHDRGGAIQGKRIDVYCGDKSKHQEALNNGMKKNCTVEW